MPARVAAAVWALTTRVPPPEPRVSRTWSLGAPDRDRRAEAEAARVVEERIGAELQARVREVDVARDLQCLGQRPQVRLDPAEVVLPDGEPVHHEALALLAWLVGKRGVGRD